MKTTLDINDELLIKAKAVSAREKISVTRLIEEGLRLRLRTGKARSAVPATKVVLPVYRGKGGLAKHIDPCSNRSMLDALDDGT